MLPPGRFSRITFWPRRACICWASTRPRESTGEPGVLGVTILMALLGQAWARAPAVSPNAKLTATRAVTATRCLDIAASVGSLAVAFLRLLPMGPLSGDSRVAL